ncbi:hypothetical protein GCM10027300_41830 [Modestobacter lapidis]
MRTCREARRTAVVATSALAVGQDADAQGEWLTRVQKLRRWTRDGQRAPHKPLLLLWLLGRLQAGRPGPVAFTELEEPVRPLLRDFGPARSSYHPEFPFHHLTGDGLWTIADAVGADARPLGTAVSRLRSAGAVGRLEPAFERYMTHDGRTPAVTTRDPGPAAVR